MKKFTYTYQLMIIIAASLAFYYPTLFAGISLIDDYDAMRYFFSEEIFSLKDVFFPRSTGACYYRPLIMLSYILDKQLWFLHERLMHFESVVAHLVNGLLVFYVCWEAVYLHLKKRETYLPLAAALLFSLHPIMTESVNWISGRTDVMMTTFVLVSVWCLLRYAGNRSNITDVNKSTLIKGDSGGFAVKSEIPPRPPLKSGVVNLLLLAGAILCGLIACLAKEAAFGYLIGLPLLARYRSTVDCQQISHNSSATLRLFCAYYITAFLAALFTGSYWLVLGIALVYLAHLIYMGCVAGHTTFSAGRILLWCSVSLSALAGAVGLLYFVRSIVFTSSVSKIGQTVTLMFGDLNYTISLFLRAIGFYVKKFLLPLPLNFFIIEIDPLYDFAGIAVLLFVCHLITSKKLPALLTLVGLLLLLPALPLAFGTIAWTAYAERYIYLSSTFWIVALCLWSGEWLEKNPARKQLVTAMVVAACLTAAGVTFWRNIIWQSNATLMRDTVAQTPKIRKLRNIYIRALLDISKTDEAVKQYHLAAKEVPSTAGDEQAALFVGGKLVSEHRHNEALALYQDALPRTQFNSEPLLSATLNLLRSMQAADTVPTVERERLAGLSKKYSALLEGIKQKKVGNLGASSAVNSLPDSF